MNYYSVFRKNYAAFYTPERNKEFTKIYEKISYDIFFPDPLNIFRFASVPVENIKCVILGMEPYASWRNVCGFCLPEATGRSFEVKSVINWNQKFKQSSLRNILKSLHYLYTGKISDIETIREEIKTGKFPISQPTDWFNEMENQGVVFLNAALTVEKDKPDSHGHLWDNFMTDLIRYMNEKNPDIIWILAGDKAQKRALSLVNKAIVCPHPRVNSFVSSCPFKDITNVNWIK